MRKSINIGLIIIAVILALSCSRNPALPNETDTEEKAKVEFYDSKMALAEFLRLDFEDMELTDIQCSVAKVNWGYTDCNTNIYIFANGSEDAFHNNQSYKFYEQQLESIPYGATQSFSSVRVKRTDMLACGLSFLVYRIGDLELDSSVDWYLLDNANDEFAGNILIIVSVPYRVELDIEKIIDG